MPIPSQTANDASILLPEQSWSLEIGSLLASVNLAGIRRGLRLGFPVSASQPIAGLTPTLTAGTLIYAANRVDLNPNVVSTAAANWTNRRIWFGLSGFYYSAIDNLPKNAKDVFLGEITTDNAGSPSIISLSQPLSLGGGRFGVRAAVNLAVAVDGSDVDLFTFAIPLGFDYVRLDKAQSRVMAITTAGNVTADDHLLKIKVDAASSATITTISAAALGTIGSTVRATADDADVYSFYQPAVIKVQYNQADVAPAIAGGWVEHILEFTLI